MTISRTVLLCVLVIVPATSKAQSASGQCWVNASSWDKHERRGTGITRLGRFDPLVADVTTFKTFKSYKGVVVTAGVEYAVYKGKKDARFQEVRLMIAAASETKPIFGLLDSSEAATSFKKRWYLTVTRRIDAGDSEHTFTLRCWDNVRFPK